MKVRVMHKVEDHNYHIRRFGRCPYCEAGSEPVPKDLIISLLEQKEGSR